MNLRQHLRNGALRFVPLVLLFPSIGFGSTVGTGCNGVAPAQEDVYAKRIEIHGVPILATDGVPDDYLYIAALVYEHMTQRRDPIDLRAAHRKSGFRILLIPRNARFHDLPEFSEAEPEIEQADGLGGSIGEFLIALRVGAPHTLVHELGHGIYHSAIQYLETGGADDEEAWYSERVRAVHGLGFEEAMESLGEEEIHEVLLAKPGTFSADLAAAWRNADAKRIWLGEYAGTEPNEYWAEGVALWFRAYRPTDEDPRDHLRNRDPLLYALCARIFPATDWDPSQAVVAGADAVRFAVDEDPDRPDKLGDCILRQATGHVPDDPYAVGDIRIERGHPLPKRMNACGITLAASSEVPDLFLRLVGEAVTEIFLPSDAVDRIAQREVLEHLHRYRACLPVPRTESELERLFDGRNGFDGGNEDELDEIMDLSSTCDIIMAEVPRGQVMEVVEHLLHAITDVGLHYRFPAEWGISRESELWRAMQRAISKGYYKIESYDDMREDAPRDVYERVLLQEFAYWFISTAWDLQRDYGPDEEEWTIHTPAELRDKLPVFFAVYERTAASVMGPPSRELLVEIGPTRAEERDG